MREKNEIKFHYTNKPESNTWKNILLRLAVEPVWYFVGDGEQSSYIITGEKSFQPIVVSSTKKCTYAAVCNFLAKKCWRSNNLLIAVKNSFDHQKPVFVFVQKTFSPKIYSNMTLKRRLVRKKRHKAITKTFIDRLRNEKFCTLLLHKS